MVAALHFVFSLVLWGLFIRATAPQAGDVGYYVRYTILHCGSAVLLFALFVTAAILAARRKRIAGALLGLGVLAAAAACWHDLTYSGPQMRYNNLDAQGCHYIYWTWWWYDN